MSTLDTVPGQAALSSYFRRCFDVLASDDAAELPEPDEELASLASPGQLHVAVEVSDSDVGPQRIVCPDGMSGDCWRERERRGDRWVWVVVCNCH